MRKFSALAIALLMSSVMTVSTGTAATSTAAYANHGTDIIGCC
jgi:hypothetical protein